MPQFLIPQTAIVGDEMTLSGDEAHHALHVMRLKTGDPIHLFDGKGKGYTGHITGLGKSSLRIKLHSTETEENKPLVSLTLAQALLPHEPMDWVIQKVTELGISHFIPLVSKRSSVKLNPQKRKAKQNHWTKIAVGACKQSGRLTVPRIDSAARLSDLIFSFHLYRSVFVAVPDTDPDVFKRSLETLKKSTESNPCLVLIGPEGGFDESEMNTLYQKGATAINLGRSILRTETASVFVAGIFHFTFSTNNI